MYSCSSPALPPTLRVDVDTLTTRNGEYVCSSIYFNSFERIFFKGFMFVVCGIPEVAEKNRFDYIKMYSYRFATFIILSTLCK
jgi:hypothetical protein